MQSWFGKPGRWGSSASCPLPEEKQRQGWVPSAFGPEAGQEAEPYPLCKVQLTLAMDVSYNVCSAVTTEAGVGSGLRLYAMPHPNGVSLRSRESRPLQGNMILDKDGNCVLTLSNLLSAQVQNTALPTSDFTVKKAETKHRRVFTLACLLCPISLHIGGRNNHKDHRTQFVNEKGKAAQQRALISY